jgi:peroxiredoxin Q/BCP
MTEPSVGDLAPDFELKTDSGRRFRLSAQRGKFVVLYFYPEDGTEGCTIENLEFSALASRFTRAGAKLVGISPDSVEKHCRFRDKHGLKATLAADPDHGVIAAYGCWGPKKTFGVEYDGVYRTTILVAPDGRIAAIWPVTRIKGHAAMVLAAVKELAANRA